MHSASRNHNMTSGYRPIMLSVTTAMETEEEERQQAKQEVPL
jgi:hypothetical protein